MYKVVLIDDETLVTRWLKEKIDWQFWDCEVVGVGSNGLEGKALVESYQPDIVISDVKMPGLNGLELSDYIRKHHPETIVILLSGFNEFDYVRTALRNEVFDYLLKPVDIEEFRMIMSKVIAELKNKLELEHQHELSEKKLAESSQLTEAGILMSLMINGNRELETLEAKMQRLGINLFKGQMVIYELQHMPNAEKWTAIYQFAIENIIQETFGQYECNPVVLHIQNRCIVVSKFPNDSLPISVWESRVREAAVEGVENIKRYMKFNVSLSIGPVFKHLSESHKAYQSALSSLASQIFWANDPGSLTEIQASYSVEAPFGLDPILFDYIEQGEIKKTEAFMHSLSSRLRMTRNIEFVYSIYVDILIRLSMISEKWEKEQDFLPLTSEIKQYRSFNHLMNTMNETVISLCAWIHEKQHFLQSNLPEKVTHYIKAKYNDPDLNLYRISDEFHVSLSHLSRVFAKAAGTSFSEYLTRIRIEHAEELMRQQFWLNNQDIAEQVGFRDGRYFSQVFKKYKGMTPNEFRGKGK